MPESPRPMDRRRFLSAAGALSMGLAMPWGRTVDPSRWAVPATRGNHSDLPPRVVGLRSLGGAFRFDPPGLLIEPGTELHWLNMGDFHTVTAFHPDNANLLAVDVPLRIPEGAASFHSGLLGLTAGTQFTHRFTVEGVYDYFCQPHYSFGMVGRIIVGGARGGPAVTRPISELIEAARHQMPPVERITGGYGRCYEWAARVNGVLFEAANGRDPESAAAAVAAGIRGERPLEPLGGGGAQDAVEDALDAFAERAAAGDDYEALLHGADRVKTLLCPDPPTG